MFVKVGIIVVLVLVFAAGFADGGHADYLADLDAMERRKKPRR